MKMSVVLAAFAFAVSIPGTVYSQTCVQGFVWREAFSGDRVCVTVAVRTRTAQDNQQAGAHRAPGGGPDGPDSCRTGFVWRDAGPRDRVCVPPETRDQAASDNRAAHSRAAAPIPPPAPPPPPKPGGSRAPAPPVKVTASIERAQIDLTQANFLVDTVPGGNPVVVNYSGYDCQDKRRRTGLITVTRVSDKLHKVRVSQLAEHTKYCFVVERVEGGVLEEKTEHAYSTAIRIDP